MATKNNDYRKSEQEGLEPGYEFIHNQPTSPANTIKILVSGRTGSGKTTLISGIIGQAKQLDVQGPDLSGWQVQLGDVGVTVWDTPGLQDGTDALNQQGYLQQMKDECSARDLSIYCIKITDTRFVHTANNPDVVAMKKLTGAFGKEFWEDCVIVLTYANILPAIFIDWNSLPPNEQINWFERKVQEWREQIQEILIHDIQVSDETVKNIKIVPAGHYRLPHLPGLEYWFSNLWFECADAIRSPAVRQALIKVNQSRMKAAQEVKDDDFKQLIQNQPIVVTERNRSLLVKVCAGGMAGGIAGALAGTTIGLAGFVPLLVTLPIGALVGMVVGSCSAGATGSKKIKQYWDQLTSGK